MNSNFLPDTEAAQVTWGDNFNNVAAAHLTELKMTQADLDPFAKSLTDFKTASASVETLKAQLRAAMETKKSAQAGFVSKARAMNLRVQGTSGVLDSLKAQLGLLVRAAPVKRPATTPLDLVVSGFETGINSLKWKPGSGGRGAMYGVEASYDGGDTWAVVGMTLASRFEQSGQTPGERVAYRVRASKNGVYSAYSNEAVAYSVLPSAGLRLVKAA